MPTTRAKLHYHVFNTILRYSRLNKVVEAIARTTTTNNGWPPVSLLAFVVYWLSSKPNATYPFIHCIMRTSFITTCVLTCLQAPAKAFKTPVKYFCDTALHLIFTGVLIKFLVARGPSTAQAPSFIADLHVLLCNAALGMAGVPYVSVTFPQTAEMINWLVSMFASTLLGVVLPTLRWYLCNGADNDDVTIMRSQQPKWDIAQIAFVGTAAVSSVWLTLAQVAALIE